MYVNRPSTFRSLPTTSQKYKAAVAGSLDIVLGYRFGDRKVVDSNPVHCTIDVNPLAF